ncbi:hypothetical protein [Spirosoma rhododendri]|uniref:Uncharacterized protein n=1 Tax=Spirosoma rhododendri TaxID=2728024 RepID=A0A7L5DM86_9BACT|nr:hypothetical protein [Spirosoma rhododendri]QJD79516.1 hypothetical protein HH216_14690 [Spirosoma rhododendri]
MNITYNEGADDERVANFLAEFFRYRNKQVESVVVEKTTLTDRPELAMRKLTITGEEIDLFDVYNAKNFGLIDIHLQAKAEKNKAVVSWLVQLTDPE